MNNIQNRYWWLFNRFVKFIGWIFFIGGLYGFVFQTILVLDPQLGTKFYDEDYFAVPEELKLISVLVYGCIAFFGYLLIKAKPWKTINKG